MRAVLSPESQAWLGCCVTLGWGFGSVHDKECNIPCPDKGAKLKILQLSSQKISQRSVRATNAQVSGQAGADSSGRGTARSSGSPGTVNVPPTGHQEHPGQYWRPSWSPEHSAIRRGGSLETHSLLFHWAFSPYSTGLSQACSAHNSVFNSCLPPGKQLL